MTPAEAARYIGCSPQHVRTMIRLKQINAKSVEMPGGYYYSIPKGEAERVRDNPPKQGWPRGVARRKK